LTKYSNFKNKKLLLAVSGGIDSIYMYHLFLENSRKNLFQIGLAHVNYNTSSTSNKSMELCKKLSIENNHSFYIKEVNLNTKSNFENNARIIRYNFFNSIMKNENYDYILTAHNKDDLIETLYMQNTDSEDYSSIPFNQENHFIIRPLIDLNRLEIDKEVKKYNYKFYEDSTNKDLKYKRNFIRHKVIPYLEKKDLKIEELLKTYHDKRKMYNIFLNTYKEEKNAIIFEGTNFIEINRNYLKSIDIYAFKLILQGVIKNKLDQLIKKTNKYWNEFYRLIKSDKKNIYQNISDDIKILIQNDKLLLSFAKKSEVCKKINDNTTWMNYRFNISSYQKNKNKKNEHTFIFPESMYNDGLYIRKWIHGDRYLISKGRSKNISDLFNEKKVKTIFRFNYPVVICNDRIEWVPGLAHSANNYLKSDNLLSITMEK